MLLDEDHLPTAGQAEECDAIIVATSDATGCAGLTAADVDATPSSRMGIPTLRLKPDPNSAVPSRLPISLADLRRFIETAKMPKVAA